MSVGRGSADRKLRAVIDRDRALVDLAEEEFDVVVVGGGVTGAGVALDAASRGFSVALVEREDYAAGTSSRSSKLVHGGLRYLQQFDLGLVREALLERSLMVKLAPHLVRPLPLVVAAFDGKRPDRLVGLGLNMYDAMAWRRGRRGEAEEWSPQRHRLIAGDEVSELLPALSRRHPTGGYLFYDCQTDDARLVLTILAEAERYGAVCANRLEAVAVAREGGRAVGAEVRDRERDARFRVRARHVVNATGVWADRLPADELRELSEAPRIRPSRGSHLLIAQERLPVRAGAIVPAKDGRSIFVLPWLGRTLVGTTDHDYQGPLEHVPPASEDVAYLLEAVNEFFETDLTVADVEGAYAGVRPLVGTGDERKSVDISRRAELFETPSGVVTITGGKLTTWRRMAQQVVDRLVEREGRRAPCRTEEIPLGLPVDPERLPRVPGVDEASIRHLAARYGHTAHEVLGLAAERPELTAPVVPGMPDLLAEVAFAARHEQARSLADVLLRRTRLGLLAPRALEPGRAERLEPIVEAMARELGWRATEREAARAEWAANYRAEGLVPSEERVGG
ncbi:glycerol-3-phosphate dehydrogenase [Thermoleophilum album]|uniref:Glycerol-3-phosphate dehydrogenase n=1 Tax=Thermoleophilum album TaxID=29539 RepID=A0A1H6FYE0_THEAL|nr:glycerol-3-phosphate dehydrogenase [Thermoleophilum album]